jgi:hypothetical protein
MTCFRISSSRERGEGMKKIILILLSLLISALIIFLPYKEYPSLAPDFTIKKTIYREIITIFTLGMWRHIAFVFVLLPLVLFLQIRPSSLKIYKRALFLIEGLAAFFAFFLMFIIMSVVPSAFMQLVIIKPIFYLALWWVLFGAIAAILLMTKKVYDKAAEFLYT